MSEKVSSGQMMENRFIFLIIIFFVSDPAPILAASLEMMQMENPNVKINPLIKASQVVCNDEVIIAHIFLHEPFSGSLYADRQPDPKCRSWGNGTQTDISLKLKVGECGVVSHFTNGKPEIRAVVYLQFHYKMQQAGDQTFRFFCSPEIFKITAVARLGVRRQFIMPVSMKAEEMLMEDIEWMDYHHEVENNTNPENTSNSERKLRSEMPNTEHNSDKEHKPNPEHKSDTQHIPIAGSVHNVAHKPKAERQLNLEHKPNHEDKPNCEDKPNDENKPNCGNQAVSEGKLNGDHKPEHELKAEHKSNAESESVTESESLEERKKLASQNPVTVEPHKEDKPKRDVKPSTEDKAKKGDEPGKKVEFKSKIHLKPKAEFTPKVDFKSSFQFNPKKGFRIKIGVDEEYVNLTEEEIAKFTSLFRPELRMFIFPGFVEPPFTTQISVNVGENMTMVIKVKEYTGFDTRIMNCKASDNTGMRYQLLIDIHGCSVNEAVLPNLKMKYDSAKENKIFYSHFRAFRFPNQDNILMSCSLSFCKGICPKPKCEDTKPRLDMNVTFGTYDLKPEGMPDFVKVSLSKDESNTQEPPFEKVSNEIDDENVSDTPMKMYQTKLNGRSSKASGDDSSDEKQERDPTCLSYTKFVVPLLFLVFVLLVSLVVTICTCVNAQELKRRLMNKAFPPYGRVQEFS